jgi:hypothetical protein
MTISQEAYARRVLERFNMHNCNPVRAPFADTSQHALHLRTEDEEAGNQKWYREVHLSVWTHTDLAYAVNTLSRFNHNPSVIHERAAKHLLRYLKGTHKAAITYYPVNHPANSSTTIGEITCYVDGSHASDPDDARSTVGYVGFMNGGAIVWYSRKQRVVAISTMEDEYMALTEASKEASFRQMLRQQIYDFHLGSFISHSTPVFSDSQAALDHVKNNVRHSRTKHIHIRHHFVRQAVAENQVSLHHIPASLQAADVLTKALAFSKHEDGMNLLLLTTTGLLVGRTCWISLFCCSGLEISFGISVQFTISSCRCTSRQPFLSGSFLHFHFSVCSDGESCDATQASSFSCFFGGYLRVRFFHAQPAGLRQMAGWKKIALQN